MYSRMPASITTTQLLALLRQRGVASARELGEAMGKSQPSVSRALAQAGDRVVRLGRARRSRYAVVRDVRGLGSCWPLYRIDETGRADRFGQVTALYGGGCLVAPESMPDWFRDEFADGVFPGVPWFVDDMRPQGFLGRQFAHRYGATLGLPDDVRLWNDDAVLATLLLHGADSPGHFVLGDRALEQALQSPAHVIATDERTQMYGSLALTALAGDPTGSSAAGEQPKFTACVTDECGDARHVIVKFTEPVDAHPTARRWADLLICEQVAAHQLAAHGHASAQAELVTSQGRLCLQSTRFDRIGAHGRRGVVTLAAWSDAHDGLRDNWAAAAERMHHVGWIGTETLEQVRLRGWFGRLIGNTDMHFGNLAFFIGDSLPLTLTPSYDMLPMRYRPAGSGAMHQQILEPPAPLPAEHDAWRVAIAWALSYWESLAELDRLSADFRQLAEGNAAALMASMRRFA